MYKLMFIFCFTAAAVFAQTTRGDAYTLANKADGTMATFVTDGGTFLRGAMVYGIDASVLYVNTGGSTWVPTNQIPRTTLPVCRAQTEGFTSVALGSASAGRTKVCICGSDGAASPAYAWCSLALTQAASVICTGGTTTACP